MPRCSAEKQPVPKTGTSCGQSRHLFGHPRSIKSNPCLVESEKNHPPVVKLDACGRSLAYQQAPIMMGGCVRPNQAVHVHHTEHEELPQGQCKLNNGTPACWWLS